MIGLIIKVVIGLLGETFVFHLDCQLSHPESRFYLEPLWSPRASSLPCLLLSAAIDEREGLSEPCTPAGTSPALPLLCSCTGAASVANGICRRSPRPAAPGAGRLRHTAGGAARGRGRRWRAVLGVASWRSRRCLPKGGMRPPLAASLIWGLGAQPWRYLQVF